VFFRETWGYVQTGQRGSDTGFSLYPKFAIPGSGANGGSGEADLAIGHFSKAAPGHTPQVLCELRLSEAPWMPIRSGRETPDPRYDNVSTI